MDFYKLASAGRAATREEFGEEKEKRLSELSAIVGFDVRKLRDVKAKNHTVWLVESTYEESMYKPPFMYASLKTKRKGWSAIFTDTAFPVAAFFKSENGAWHSTEGSFDFSVPVTDDQIRKSFAERLASVGIKVEDLADRPAPVTAKTTGISPIAF